MNIERNCANKIKCLMYRYVCVDCLCRGGSVRCRHCCVTAQSVNGPITVLYCDNVTQSDQCVDAN